MANTLTGTIIAEKYRLGDVLRSGVQGDLYEARHVLMDKPVSVFVLRPGLAADSANVERFFAEAKAASGVDNAHILNILDFGTDRDGHVYSVYEPLQGMTLKQVIAEDGAFPVHSSVAVATQIAEGLAAAHAGGIKHGNLSTDNVYLTGENGLNAKVVDFGSPNPIIADSTDAGDFSYLAPEQCSGSDHSDERGDVYALGVILFELLAGVPPYVGERPTDVMLKHIEEMPAPMSAFRTDVPEQVEAVIAKALSKNPEMRQQSAREFADELQPLYGEIPADAPAPKNNLWKTAFIVLVGMSLLSAFMIYGTYTKQTDPTTAVQPDANGMPVQPINPATGTEEQNLAMMPPLTVDAIANSNMTQPPGTLPGGDNYNPWGNGGAPPPGAPYIPPGGQVVTIDPATGSPFMPTDGVVLVPVPVNTNTNSARSTPTPKPSTANANTTVPQPTPVTPSNTTQTKPSPTPRTTRTPARPPANRPAANTTSGEGTD